MRRSDRQQDLAFSLALIDACTHGVVAFSAQDGTPYCIPLSLVRVSNRLYFHCAREGRKIDLLRKNPRVCVSFIGEDTPGFEQPSNFTTFFQSVVVSGTASEVTETEEKIAALRALCEKITPEHMSEDRFDLAIRHSLGVTSVWRIDMDEITGKAKKRV